MNADFEGNEDDFWKEFKDPKTSAARKVRVLYSLAYRANLARDLEVEAALLANGLDLAREHGLKDEENTILVCLSRKALNTDNEAEEAIRLTTEVIEKNPDFVPDEDFMSTIAEAYMNRGRALKRLDRDAEAIASFRVCLNYAEFFEDTPTIANSQRYLAKCHLALGELEAARKAINIARKLYQDNSQMFDVADCDFVISRILIEDGQYVQAVQLLRQVRLLERKFWGRSKPETKLYIGVAYFHMNQHEQAEPMLRRVYDEMLRPWEAKYKLGIEAGNYLVRTLEALGRTDEATEIALTVQAFASRLPDSKQDDSKKVEAIDELLETGAVDIALTAAGEFLEEKNNLGDVSGRWIGLYQQLKCHWAKNDFEAIAVLWDQSSQDGLNFQDEIVIPFKNMVTHALQKVGRKEDALNLNDQVLSDFRLESSAQEKVYAHENRARILKLMKHKEANKFRKLAEREYLELGDSQRALNLLDFWESQNKKRWDNY